MLLGGWEGLDDGHKLLNELPSATGGDRLMDHHPFLFITHQNVVLNQLKCEVSFTMLAQAQHDVETVRRLSAAASPDATVDSR
jgi:hypothetical protein